MTAAAEQYEECLTRLFDNPYDADLREEILVHGDALEAESDPRGRRVALSEALYVETDRDRRAELRRELNAMTNAERKALFGPSGPMLEYKRALEIEWRGGAAYAARVDARYLTKLAKITEAELLAIVLKAPVVSTIRRLSVRIGGDYFGNSLLAQIESWPQGSALEEVIIGAQPRPARILHRLAEHVYRNGNDPRLRLAAAHPNLWLISTNYGVAPLLPRDGVIGWNGDALAADVDELKGGSDIETRLHIGRSLWAPEPELRVAAARAVARFGLVGVFADSISYLLRRGVVDNQAEIITALAEAGAGAAMLAPLFARMSGSMRYPPETRSAAGKALHHIRSELMR